MPLYTFSCANGHSTERLAAMSVTGVACFCGDRAKRESVYQHSTPRKWASDFQVPAEARAALDEATGYKREALQAKEEAVRNGFPN
jgi:hypothetical protein